MVTVNAHFDGKTIVLDEPLSLPLQSGARLKLTVEPVDEVPPVTPPRRLRPLDIEIEPDLSHAIALDPALNIEEP